MASYTISPIWGAGAQLFDNSGNVLTGGKIYTYNAGTTTPAETYTNPIGTVANSNPIIANAAGRLTNEIWLPVSGAYKFVLKDANDVLIATYDNIPTTAQPPISNDASSISYESGYEVTAGNFTIGATYLITSVGNTDFVAIGAAANVTGILFTATGIGSGTGTAEFSRTVQTKLREIINVKDYGAVGDGVTDDTASIQAAIAAANAAKTFLIFDGDTYLISSPLTMPDIGISGKAVITGDLVQWVEIKNPQINGELVCDELLLDSVWFAKFDKIYCTGDITLQSSDPTWGTFWNNFGNIFCAGTLIINVDQGQSVNGNIFQNVVAQGGVHIVGVNTTGIREAYNNVFQTLDTTGANLTASDATTGWHILNDSKLNQTNTVMNWNAEVSGNRGVKGNWNILGSNIDANTSVLSITERNHYLFSGTTIDRNDGDFLAAGVNNLAVGGEWDVIDSTMTRPYCISPWGTTAASANYGTTGCPSQIPYEYSRETSSINSGFTLNFDFDSAQTVVVAMWYQGDDFVAIYSDGGYYTDGLIYTDASGWKLLRIVATGVTSFIRFALNGASASFKRCSINSVFATNLKTCVLPSKKSGNRIAKGSISLPSGSSANISLPTGGYIDYLSGLCKISAVAYPVTPSFAGIVGAIDVEFSKTRYANIDNSTVIGNVNKAIGQLNTTGKDITVTGNTTGINLALTSGVDPCTVDYEIELYTKLS